jgi:hypothetical protein
MGANEIYGLPIASYQFPIGLSHVQTRLTARTEPITHRSRKGFTMKKKSRIELAREIIARVKREMDKPRLTASVRDGNSGRAAAGVKWPVRARANAGS